MTPSYFLTCTYLFLAGGRQKELGGTQGARQGSPLLESSDSQNCSSVLLAAQWRVWSKNYLMPQEIKRPLRLIAPIGQLVEMITKIQINKSMDKHSWAGDYQCSSHREVSSQICASSRQTNHGKAFSNQLTHLVTNVKNSQIRFKTRKEHSR